MARWLGRRTAVAGLLAASGHYAVASSQLVAVVAADRLVDRTPYVGLFLNVRYSLTVVIDVTLLSCVCAEGAAEKAANVTSDGIELALEQEVTTVK